jgi:anti-sigma factor RsiW
MSRHLSAEVLVDLADGDLPADAAKDAERHLAGCATCSAELDALRRVEAQVASLAVARLARRAVARVPSRRWSDVPLAEVAGQTESIPARDPAAFVCSFDDPQIEVYCFSGDGAAMLVLHLPDAAREVAVRAAGLRDGRRLPGGWIGWIDRAGAQPLAIEIDCDGTTCRVDLLAD